MPNNTKRRQVYLGADHNGFKLKKYLKEFLERKGHQVEDLGNKKLNIKDDYPDYAKKVAKKVARDKQSLGILMCGSGQGMCMTANKFKNVRAALGWTTGAAKKSRYDDDSNILCLPAWRVSHDQARRIVNGWLNTPFSKIARHKRRIKKIKA
ncbi:RpiB/LacA/LacB family sugar-phosphate isomerase [bacterium]|nr:RpiB/LacA/LacB family sugar-phosphate isomerase [bacterium]